MSRDTKGRFLPGFCGNTRGRPRKQKRTISEMQLWSDVLLTFEEEIPVSIDGKSRKMPANLVILKRLRQAAVAGDPKFVFKAIDLRQRAILHLVDQQLKLMETVLEGEKDCRRFPEDVTDEFKRILRHARQMIESGSLI